MRNMTNRNPRYVSRQRGAVTMFSAVLILILLTEMIIYAVQVGVFEQRKSSNEMMQKLAFHTADSAIQVGKQFLSANVNLLISRVVDYLPDGTDGWLAPGAERWQPCSTIGGTSGTHPCFGEPVQAFRNGSYFYSFADAATDADFDLPLDPDALSASGNETVRLHALLCMLEIDRNQDPMVLGCTTDPAKQDRRYFMLTLLARGEADCNDNGENCGAEALIAEKLGSFGPAGSNGGPGAPLTARTTVPLSGTVEIVPNPNGGGVGVPISSWVNGENVDPITPISGSYSTCEAHEWYGQDMEPVDIACAVQSGCSCEKSKERLLTYADGNVREMGIDILVDPAFPDLWLYTFDMDWESVKEKLVKPENVLTSCDSLNEYSEGLFWISGAECDIKTQIGSGKEGEERAVFLISAAANTKVSAGGSLFGVLFVTDKEIPGAEFTGNGHATIYGQAIMDASMDNFNGTFQIVHNDKLLDLARETPLFGPVAGGWTDFHESWR